MKDELSCRLHPIFLSLIEEELFEGTRTCLSSERSQNDGEKGSDQELAILG